MDLRLTAGEDARAAPSTPVVHRCRRCPRSPLHEQIVAALLRHTPCMKPQGGSVAGRIVLIGSGEIGPSMAPLHRALVASLPARRTPASLVALDGSYDFQTNRAEMGEKIAGYFRSKVGIPTSSSTMSLKRRLKMHWLVRSS